MKRRTFIKQLLAMGLMTPSLNAAAIHLITATPDKNAAVPVGETQSIHEWVYENAVIKVIGVGGCGCNALNLMIDKGVYSAEYIAIDSDAQALNHSKAGTNLQIDVANIEANRTQISRLINDAHMVFIVAGMGGETGTVAAALVAQVSHELNILTIVVVTSPSAGGTDLVSCTEFKVLRENVDSLIVIPIDDLMKIHSIAIPEAFKIASGVMLDAVAGIAEVVNFPGMIGVDFSDVCTVMSENGSAMVGSGGAAGPDRARLAAERAIASPLFDNMNLSDALGVLVNITSTSSLKLREMDEIIACVQIAAEEATITVGSIFDESMGDEMRVTVVATGLGLPEIEYSERRAASLAELDSRNERMKNFSDGNYDIPAFLRKKSI